jgi:hypothetical protein
VYTLFIKISTCTKLFCITIAVDNPGIRHMNFPGSRGVYQSTLQGKHARLSNAKKPSLSAFQRLKGRLLAVNVLRVVVVVLSMSWK